VQACACTHIAALCVLQRVAVICRMLQRNAVCVHATGNAVCVVGFLFCFLPDSFLLEFALSFGVEEIVLRSIHVAGKIWMICV